MKKLVVLVALAVAALLAASAGASAAYVELGSFANNGSGDGGAGSENGQLRSPGAADVRTSDGKLYVADTNNDRVEVFAGTATGGTYDGQVAIPAPAGLAIDQSTGDVYVSNASGVSKFDADLNPVAGWHVAETGTLTVDPVTHDLLVADIGASLIRRYSSAGVAGPTFIAARPLDVAVDSTGDVIVVTSTGDIIGDCGATSAVERFTGAGVSEGLVGSLQAPGSVAVDPDDDGVVVGAVVNQWNCGTEQPVVAQFAPDGTPGPVTTLAADALYAMVPGLAAVGGGSSRIYAVTKSPYDDIFGATAVRVLQDIAPPTVSDPTLANLAGEHVDVSAGVNPNGTTTTWKFELSSDGGATWTASPGGNAGAGNTLVTITETLPGLQPKTDYRVRTIANNGIEVTSGETAFTTPAVAPNAQTHPATGVTKGSAKLNATIDPQASPTTYWFEYGTTTTYGGRVPAGTGAAAGNGNDPIPVTQTANNLDPDTTYHYRVVAHNAEGTTNGADQAFTTQAAETEPTLDNCPNATVRAQQGVTGLPDCRAYEQVTPTQKYGIDANFPAVAAANGSGVGYSAAGGFLDAQVGGANSYVARRQAAGWTSDAITPQMLDDPTPTAPVQTPTLASYYASDMSSALLVQGISRAVASAPSGSNRAVFLHDIGSGFLDWITEPAATSASGQAVFYPSGTSTNLEHVVFRANPVDPAADTVRLIDADAPRQFGAGLYDYTGGALRPVGVLPDGSIPAYGAVTPVGITTGATSGSGVTAGSMNNQVSRDGNRIVFVSPDPGAGAPDPSQLYLRVGGIETQLVSKSMLTGEPAASGGSFTFASPDGTKVWFTATDQLTAGAPPTGGLYEFDSATETVTFVREMDEVRGGPLVSSDDGFRYLYVKPGTRALWISDAGVERRVADPVGFRLAVAPPAKNVRATPDGSHFLFTSENEINEGTFNNGSGLEQVYRYDTDKSSLDCVSCPGKPEVEAEGSQIIGGDPAGSFQMARAMSADGQRVVFQTTTPLVTSDINGRRDVYLWQDGGVQLISSGRGRAHSDVSDISSDGSNIFFTTSDQLVSSDTDGSLDVYDARVGGGFLQPPAPAECGLSCQKPPAGSPPPPVVSSLSFGTGNVAGGSSSTRVSVTKKVVKGAAFTLSVKVPAKGRITATGSGLRTVKKTAGKAATYKLTLRLTAKAKKRLKKQGRLKVNVRVRYTPAGGGGSSTSNVSVTLKA